MTDTARFPSEQFPAQPAVTIPQPEGWHPIAAEAPLIAIGPQSAAGEFQPNVVVTSRRVVGEAVLEAAALATTQSLEGSQEWEEAGREYRDGFGGRPSFRIEGAFSTQQAGTVYQCVLTTVVQQGPFTDVVQVTGTCSASQTATLLPTIREVLRGAELTV